MQAALLSGAVTALLSTSAMAADLGSSMKDAPIEVPPPPPEHNISVVGGLTSDYVFRGISQSDNDPAIFAGAELGYRFFYVGFWGASVADYVNTSGAEVDIYGGFRKSWNGVEFDVGAIWYTYPGNFFSQDYVEVKGSAGLKLWRDLAVTGTVYWSPDYLGDGGNTWTFEGKAAIPLPWWGLSLSGGGGFVTADGDDNEFLFRIGDDNYAYWNVGLSKTFRDRYTFDVRYWGTNVDDNGGDGFDFNHGIADDRVVGTFTFTY